MCIWGTTAVEWPCGSMSCMPFSLHIAPKLLSASPQQCRTQAWHSELLTGYRPSLLSCSDNAGWPLTEKVYTNFHNFTVCRGMDDGLAALGISVGTANKARTHWQSSSPATTPSAVLYITRIPINLLQPGCSCSGEAVFLRAGKACFLRGGDMGGTGP